MKKIVSLLLVALMVFFAVGCGTDSSTKTDDTGNTDSTSENTDVVKVGVFCPLTGGSAFMGSKLKQGYEYAAEYYNSQGGIKSLGGAKLELSVVDTAGHVDTANTELERLINNVKVDICTGPYNSAVLIGMANNLEKYNMPFVVSQASAYAIYSSGYTTIFNPANNAKTNALGLVNLVKMIGEKYGEEIGNVGFLMENNEWGLSQKDAFEKYFKANNIDVIYNETFETGTTDFSSQILKMKSDGVKFIIPCISPYNDALLFVRQMKEYKCDAGILASGGVFVTADFTKALGEDANGIFSTDTWNKDFLPTRGEEAVQIHQGYVDEYGENMNENSGLAFTAMSVIVAALEAAGSTDHDAVLDALNNMDLPEDSEYMRLIPFHGMKFGVDEEGWANTNIYNFSMVSQLIDGEWRSVWPDDILPENPIRWPIQ